MITSPNRCEVGMDFRHPLPRCECVADRQRLILEYCRNKTVLHLGCVESGNVQASYACGSLLHLQLLNVAKRVIGVDIDLEGIEFLRERGMEDLFCADLELVDLRDIAEQVEVVIAGEILEHLLNPGIVLENIGKLLANSNGLLIVTVPNAFSIRHFLSVLFQNIELVMPDHNFWFSRATLSSLLRRTGFEAVKWYTYFETNRIPQKVRGIVKKGVGRTAFRAFPFLAEGIIVVARRSANVATATADGKV